MKEVHQENKIIFFLLNEITIACRVNQQIGNKPQNVLH